MPYFTDPAMDDYWPVNPATDTKTEPTNAAERASKMTAIHFAAVGDVHLDGAQVDVKLDLETGKVHVRIEEGWHVYSQSESNGVPSQLSLEAPVGLSTDGSVRAPEPELYEMQFVGKLQIHRGELVFRQSLRVASDAAAGALALPVGFTYQACSEGEGSVCLMPNTSEGKLSLEITAGESATAGISALSSASSSSTLTCSRPAKGGGGASM